MTSYNTSNISLPSLKWWVSSVSWVGPFYWNGSANTLIPFKISVLLIYEAGLTHLQKSLLRQPVSRQPGLSYKHSKNFIRTQGISRASRIKQASWANRAGSLHINRPLTLCSHYARYLCSAKKTKPGIGLLFTLKNCDFGAISGKEPSCALPISKGSLAYSLRSRRFFDVCFFSSFVVRKVRITAERYAEPRSKKKTMREGRV